MCVCKKEGMSKGKVRLLSGLRTAAGRVFLCGIGRFGPRSRSGIFVLVQDMRRRFTERLVRLFSCSEDGFLSVDEGGCVRSAGSVT